MGGVKMKNYHIILARIARLIVYLIIAAIALLFFVMYLNTAEGNSLSKTDIFIFFLFVIIMIQSVSYDKLKSRIEELESRVAELEGDGHDYSPHGYLYDRD